MASYYVSGYTPPAGYTDRDSVKQLQQTLNSQGAGLKVDGVYGPKTHAAYSQSDSAGSGAVSYVPTQYKNYVSELQNLLGANEISYSPTSEAQYASMIQQALRPGYDLAISQRKDAAKSSKAEIDADAAARGMGSSTWVTDVKDRQNQYAADDIATLEGKYAAAYASQLMDALNAEKKNQLAVDQFNASQRTNAQTTALGLANSFYSQYLSEQASNKKKSSSGNTFSYAAAIAMDDIVDRLAGDPNKSQGYLQELEKNKTYDKAYGAGATEAILAKLYKKLYGEG